MTIERYTPAIQEEWNRFVAESRNGTFLFDRRYMDYHSDRFQDFSLVVRGNKGEIIMVLPANITGDTLYSHQGLTFGGWILGRLHPDGAEMLEAWESMNAFLRGHGINRLIYTPVPHIFHRNPSEEDIYAIFRNGGKIDKVLISSVVDLTHPTPFSENARRNAAKSVRAGVTVIRDNSLLPEFHAVLSTLLAGKYSTTPVHTLDELRMLAGRFPERIQLYAAILGTEVIGGTILYHSGTVSRCQYIAATPAGQSLGALYHLFHTIITDRSLLLADTRYLDFGTSNEHGGTVLNTGLLTQKARMGGRGIAYTTYRIEV